ncbi:hypothetical protein JTE90_027708 [Oedothorax gibbosus]|uniref:Uncharacterized protein n=1 Tax=Oedothorax gibbosus TaxID=931172 RepID=A0AAV6UUR7_9ARAC|nr:hypothetical protein JTE90_027708 [Oedothorax gibbosus]
MRIFKTVQVNDPIRQPVQVNHQIRQHVQVNDPIRKPVQVNHQIRQPVQVNDPIRKPVQVNHQIRQHVQVNDPIRKPVQVNHQIRQHVQVNDPIRQPVQRKSKNLNPGRAQKLNRTIVSDHFQKLQACLEGAAFAPSNIIAIPGQATEGEENSPNLEAATDIEAPVHHLLGDCPLCPPTETGHD